MSNVKDSKVSKLYSILVVVFLGALGSGLWDFLLKDFLYSLSYYFVSVLSWFYKGYLDSLYKDVGRQLDIFLYFPSIFLMVFIIGFMFYFMLYFSNRVKNINRRRSYIVNVETLEVKESNNRNGLITYVKLKALYLVMILLSIFTSLLYVNELITSLSQISAVKQMERNFSIIRPYISDNEYHYLISEFRMIDDLEKYQILYHKVEDYAISSNIKLPKSKLYGINSKYENNFH